MVKRVGNYALRSLHKKMAKPGQFPGEVPNALLDCFSTILTRFCAPFASLEIPFEIHGSLDPHLEIPFE